MFDPIEKSLNIKKKYVDENGEVFLSGGDDFYAISVSKHETPWLDIYYQRGRLDAIAATEFFDVAKRYVCGEIQWTEPIRKFSCTFNPNQIKGCTDKNCPKKLGGANYREIFGISCPYRKKRTR